MTLLTRRNLDFSTALLKYALNPTEYEQKKHRNGIFMSLCNLISNILLYGLINIIYFNHIYNCNNKIWTILPLPLVIIFEGIMFIDGLRFLRDCIFFDMEALFLHRPYKYQPEYQNIRVKVNEFCAHDRYYTYKQNMVKDCAICLDYLDHNANNISLIACGHSFHIKCIEQSEESTKTVTRLRKIVISKCPICRQNMQ